MSTSLMKAQARAIAAGAGPAASFHQDAKTLTAASTLSVADNGTTFYLNSATEFATTLPAPLLGLKFKFIVAAAPVGTNYTVVTKDGDNVVYGSAASSAAVTPAGAPASAEDSINFVASAALEGDYVEVEADGTNWYAAGLMSANGGITFTVT